MIYGDTHRREEGLRVGNVLLVQPRPWAQDVARVDITLAREGGGPWTLKGVASRLLPVLPTTPPDPAARSRDPRDRAPLPRGGRALPRAARRRVARGALRGPGGTG